MNEQDIPIDIHVNKLSDWLVSRRICDKNWQRNVKDVRNQINEAIKDMPGNQKLIELLSGSCKYNIHDQVMFWKIQKVLIILINFKF
jgi:CDK5 regulatory subunit-associated protein 3